MSITQHPMTEREVKRDAVTVGQIRAVLLNTLERDMTQLTHQIRKGYHGKQKTLELLNAIYDGTLKQLYELDNFACTAMIAGPMLPIEVPAKPPQPMPAAGRL